MWKTKKSNLENSCYTNVHLIEDFYIRNYGVKRVEPDMFRTSSINTLWGQCDVKEKNYSHGPHDVNSPNIMAQFRSSYIAFQTNGRVYN